MQITLSPQYETTPLVASRAGDTITLNGAVIDFSAVAEGETVPASDFATEWLQSDVTRTAGVLHFALRLPIGTGAPVESRFPAPITVTEDGPIQLPPFSAVPL